MRGVSDGIRRTILLHYGCEDIGDRALPLAAPDEIEQQIIGIVSAIPQQAEMSVDKRVARDTLFPWVKFGLMSCVTMPSRKGGQARSLLAFACWGGV
jgi:hypothetical protein